MRNVSLDATNSCAPKSLHSADCAPAIAPNISAQHADVSSSASVQRRTRRRRTAHSIYLKSESLDPALRRALVDRFYTETDERSAKGESLVVWVRSDFRDLAGAFIGALRGRWGRER